MSRAHAYRCRVSKPGGNGGVWRIELLGRRTGGTLDIAYAASWAQAIDAALAWLRDPATPGSWAVRG